jgi:glutathione S-transferase
MTLRLYFHPFSSFCQKVVIALYENDTPFETVRLNHGDAAQRAAFLKIWPLGKMPVLRDEAADQTVPESSIIIEYLARYYPGPTALVPKDPDLAWRTRMVDRLYDLYVETPMQKIVGDRLRPAEAKDPYGVAQARDQLTTVYGMIEHEMGSKTWAMGTDFTLVDCGAAPALFFANMVHPFGAAHPNIAAYLGRLAERPSVARTFAEARPYLDFFPKP